jgi:hypothetical protein
MGWLMVYSVSFKTILKYSHSAIRHTTAMVRANIPGPHLNISKRRKGSATRPVIKRFKCIIDIIKQEVNGYVTLP